MKITAILATAILFALSGRASLVLNEIYLDVGGNATADSNKEFVEIYSTTGLDSLNDVWLLEIEGDGPTSAGLVDMARNLSTLSLANGFLTLGDGYSTVNPYTLTTEQTGLADLGRTGSFFMENGATTFMLVTGFTGAVGSDIDANGDGVIDNALWTSILDSVSNRDGALGADFVYGPDLVGTVAFTGLDAFARLNGNTAANNLSSWYGGRILADDSYDPANITANLPTGATLTPGASNFPVVPEPSSFALLLAGFAALRLRRWSGA